MEDELRESDDAYLEDSRSSSQLAHSDNEDAEIDEGEHGDNTSIATDASELEDLDDPADADQFDFTSLQGKSKAAFDEQTIARVFFELEGAAPKLLELTDYLRHCNSLEQRDDRDRARSFQRTISSLQHELARLVNTHPIPNTSSSSCSTLPLPSTQSDSMYPSPPPIPFLPSIPVTPPRPSPSQPKLTQQKHGNKRKLGVLDIIGASPEKASKRTQSFRPH